MPHSAMARQAGLDEEDGPVPRALLSESLLESPCGGRDIMRAQLAQIRHISERPDIGVRVVPKAPIGRCVRRGRRC
ncbi:Scr1 family TA system antitoxin-like transcriptional regulator [Actinoallomurus sp. NPDC052274]|uniref:Scr1 family TA system antitoxin-like transcriptional regulator n=1 Tax=Actinoallomurus sp. NPDC052274 TaxID=3155420 RepID=UPI0034376C75